MTAITCTTVSLEPRSDGDFAVWSINPIGSSLGAHRFHGAANGREDMSSLYRATLPVLAQAGR
jgi:hypothetical protein